MTYDETHRGYLDGPDAETLIDSLVLDDWGRHQEYGARGCLTPRAIAVLALSAGVRKVVRYKPDGSERVLTLPAGIAMQYRDNEVLIAAPDGRPGHFAAWVDIDTITSVEVIVDDGLVRERTEGRLISREELADRLSISLRTVDHWVKTQGMPSKKFGSARRFDLEQVMAWNEQRNAGAKV